MYFDSWNETTQEEQKGFLVFFFPMTPYCESICLSWALLECTNTQVSCLTGTSASLKKVQGLL